jgi:hypothetical protein
VWRDESTRIPINLRGRWKMVRLFPRIQIAPIHNATQVQVSIDAWLLPKPKPKPKREGKGRGGGHQVDGTYTPTLLLHNAPDGSLARAEGTTPRVGIESKSRHRSCSAARIAYGQ